MKLIAFALLALAALPTLAAHASAPYKICESQVESFVESKLPEGTLFDEVTSCEDITDDVSVCKVETRSEGDESGFSIKELNVQILSGNCTSPKFVK